MEVLVLDTDPMLTAIHQVMHHPEEMHKIVKTSVQRPQVNDSKALEGTPVDVKERSDSYVFVADIPGLKRTDIEVQVENENVLTMRGKRKLEEKAEEDTTYLRR